MNEILFEEFQELEQKEFCPTIHPHTLLNDLQRRYREKIQLLATRARFGFHNTTDFDGKGIIAAFPTRIADYLKSIVDKGRDELQHTLAWESHPHATTMTYDAGSFQEMEVKQRQMIRFCMHTYRTQWCFSIPIEFVKTIALASDIPKCSETIWANPLFKPNGRPRSQEHLRAIAKICGIGVTQLKDLLGTKNAYSNLCTSFERGHTGCHLEVWPAHN